jgi:hypothetical protein
VVEEGQERVLESCETRYLSTEVAQGFTGVYFALYNVSFNEKACQSIVSMIELDHERVE